MSNVDWSQAPRDAEFFANGHFRKRVTGTKNPQKWISTGWASGNWSLSECVNSPDYQQRPQQWPDEQRLEIIGHNGPTGEHYAVVDLFEAELVKEGYSKDMLHKNTVGQYYQGYLNSLFKWFAKGVQAQCNK